MLLRFAQLGALFRQKNYLELVWDDFHCVGVGLVLWKIWAAGNAQSRDLPPLPSSLFFFFVFFLSLLFLVVPLTNKVLVGFASVTAASSSVSACPPADASSLFRGGDGQRYN